MSTFDIIKQKVKIRDIYDLGEPIPISSGWKAACPFHAEKEPSFKVTESATGDLFYCHGCKSGGDVFTFVEQYLHLNSREAYIALAKRAGVDVGDYEYPTDEFEALIGKLETNHSFFKQKDISKKTLEIFGVGYIKDISGMKLDKKFMSRWKLSMVSDAIFYSIKNRSGLTIGYYVRPLHGGTKYVGNSPMYIFGLHAIPRGCSHVIAVEGFNDVLKLYDKGIRNTISVCGTNFNETILRTLGEHGIRRVIFVPDLDVGGLEFTNQIVSKYGTFDTHGVSVGYAQMPYDKGDIDPDEYIDIDKEFFVNLPEHEVSATLAYYDGLGGTTWSRVTEILYNKPFLPPYEIQLALKERVGVELDIRSAGRGFYDVKAERLVLGNMLRDMILKAKMAVELDSSWFAMPEHKRIFTFIKDKASATVDTVASEFGITIVENDIHANDIYMEKLDVLRKKRSIYSALTKHMGDVYATNMTPDVVIQNIVNEFAGLVTGYGDIVTADNVVLSAIHAINSDAYDGIPMVDRFPNMSNLMRGLLKGKLVIVAGNSGHGKTSLALNMLDSISIRQGYKSIFFSGEMSAEELMLRMFSIYTGQSYNDIINRRYKVDDKSLKALMTKNVMFAPLPSLEDLYGKIKMACMRYSGVNTVFLDYVQLIRSSKATGFQRYQELSGMTQLLKDLAGKLGICVVALAQLNKEGMKSEVAKIENLSGAYDMVSDADVGITIMKKTGTINCVTEGNAQLNIDKLRYNQDDVIIPIYYNSANLRMRELTANF